MTVLNDEQSPSQDVTTRGGSLLGNSVKALGAVGLVALALDAQSNPPSDIDVLNFALTLEHLEANFYTTFLSQFGSAQNFGPTQFQTAFQALNFGVGGPFGGTGTGGTGTGTGGTGTGTGTGTTSEFGDTVTPDLYTNLLLIRDHEQQHVRTLTALIRSLGGTPVPACVYNFSVNNVNDFLTTADLLENTGVMAYDGSANLIKSPAVRTAAATIATVEARHAAFLNLVTGTSPFPAAFDTPMTMAQILAAAGKFIVSCPAS